MKQITGITIIAAAVFVCSLAFAADYSGYSNEELSRIRGTLQNATEQERQQFRSEWQSRLQNMTQEERQQYAGRPDNAGQGQEQMIRQRKRIHQQSATPSGGYGAGSGAAARGGKGYGAAGGRGNR